MEGCPSPTHTNTCVHTTPATLMEGIRCNYLKHLNQQKHCIGALSAPLIQDKPMLGTEPAATL